MQSFDPVQHVDNSQRILVDGEWPNFHDAEVHDLHIWRGDVRPDDRVWIGPRISLTFELCSLEKPFIAELCFHDCEDIQLGDFNNENAIYDLEFWFEERGEDNNGEPLTPYIYVNFEQAFGMGLSFKCFKVEVVERREI